MQVPRRYFCPKPATEVDLRREEDLTEFNTHPDQDSSDEEKDSPCPHFDQLYGQGGNAAIRDIFNFIAYEFEML